MRAQYDGADVIGFRLTDIPEEKTMDMDRKSETAAKLSFLKEHSPALSSLPSGLDAAVGEEMFKTGSDFTKALKEVTRRNPRMAALWEGRLRSA